MSKTTIAVILAAILSIFLGICAATVDLGELTQKILVSDSAPQQYFYSPFSFPLPTAQP